MKSVIFDLDGVLADTATGHFRAWLRLAQKLELPFDEAFNERLKGVDRRTSLELLLAPNGHLYNEAQKLALMARKNAFYLEIIQHAGPADLLPGALDLLRGVRRLGLSTALASASRNAPALVERLGLAPWLDVVADANCVANAKPDPEIFLLAASLLGTEPADCVGVEDSAAGITAIKTAGMRAVGVGTPAQLKGADAIAPTTAAITMDMLLG